jgi:hypothetical protein
MYSSDIHVLPLRYDFIPLARIYELKLFIQVCPNPTATNRANISSVLLTML